MRGLLKPAMFTLIAVLLFFSFIEGLFRLMGEPPSPAVQGPKIVPGQLPDNFAQDAKMGWVQRGRYMFPDPVYATWARQWGEQAPVWDGFKTNSRGFRDTEPTTPRPAGQVRVLSLGDSSVAGIGAPRLQTFSERLERALNDPWTDDPASRAVEVFNTGVSGYSSFQSLLLLEKSLDLEPDIVLFYNMNSDLMTAQGASDAEFYRGWAHVVAGHPLGSFATYRWLRHALKGSAIEAKMGPTLRVPLSDYEANLRALVQQGASQGFQVMFIIPPTPDDLLNPQPSETYMVTSEASASRLRLKVERAREGGWQRQTREVFRMAMSLVGFEAGVPVIDGPGAMVEAYLADYARYADGGGLFADELHPSGEGHRVIAEATLPALRAQVEVARAGRRDRVAEP